MLFKTRTVTSSWRRTAVLVAAVCAAFFAASAHAELRLPHLFSDDMVLQRQQPISIWGWSDPGEAISVRLDQTHMTTKAGADGQWMVKLPAHEAGGPYELIVSGKKTVRFKNVMVGEVWICSGQSNMELSVRFGKDWEKEIAAADHPDIRLFIVPRGYAKTPATDVDASWMQCSPQSITKGGWNGFSAAGYYFGRELHDKLKVPIGLIESSYGGTRIEAWTPLDATATPHPELIEADHQDAATALFNGMVHPLVPYAMRGVIWYQGENNVGDGMRYCDKMKTLIGSWRNSWGEGDFPFYYVQIAPFNSHGNPDLIPELWQAQSAVLSVPNTGMAVTLDVTEDLNDHHPHNKQAVGHRLALWALAKTYGQNQLTCSGPLFKSAAREGNEVRLLFDHVGQGLTSRDGKPLSWFETAGADGAFFPADARIDDDCVVVHCDKIAEPATIRFAWNEAASPNLMNKDGLPAPAFCEPVAKPK